MTLGAMLGPPLLCSLDEQRAGVEIVQNDRQPLLLLVFLVLVFSSLGDRILQLTLSSTVEGNL
jgi:hypothetical protein